ncbi:MAG: rRNA adenine N-6-methyltransferase family protein [Bacteroidota bacterium]
MKKQNNKKFESRIDFFRESIKNLKTTGTVTRSSDYLCKKMIKHVDFDNAETIIEIGAGDGVITRHILNQMKSETSLIVFEVNPKFCEKLRGIDDKRLTIIEDSAENIEQYVDHKVDYMISAIPFVMLPKKMTISILNVCKRVLANRGKFIQLHYSLILKSIYKRVFGNVKVNFVPINIPPAFVLVSQIL